MVRTMNDHIGETDIRTLIDYLRKVGIGLYDNRAVNAISEEEPDMIITRVEESGFWGEG